MAKTLVNTIQVKNLTGQVIPLFVRPLANSPIYSPAGGQAHIVGHATLEAEESRFDSAQLEQARRNRTIDTTKLVRQVDITLPGNSGTIPPNA